MSRSHSHVYSLTHSHTHPHWSHHPYTHTQHIACTPAHTPTHVPTLNHTDAPHPPPLFITHTLWLTYTHAHMGHLIWSHSPSPGPWDGPTGRYLTRLRRFFPTLVQIVFFCCCSLTCSSLDSGNISFFFSICQRMEHPHFSSSAKLAFYRLRKKR